MSGTAAASWKIRGRTLDLAQPLACGIVNVTADSMFSGARSETPEQAVRDGLRLIGEGFDLLDIGAVAARSGAPVPPDQEADLLVPAIEGLAGAGVPLSADTFSAEVARDALEAGAHIVNDISGGAEGAMLELAAESGCGLVLMHIEGPPRVDRSTPEYDDVIGRLVEFFGERIAAAATHGVDPDQISIDPGLDFDLSMEDDVEILARLDELHSLGRPIFMALSRKDFLGALVAGSWDHRAPAEDREWATAAAAALAVRSGAQLLRLHDPSALQAMRMAAAVSRP